MPCCRGQGFSWMSPIMSVRFMSTLWRGWRNLREGTGGGREGGEGGRGGEGRGGEGEREGGREREGESYFPS